MSNGGKRENKNPNWKGVVRPTEIFWLVAQVDLGYELLRGMTDNYLKTCRWRVANLRAVYVDVRTILGELSYSTLDQLIAIPSSAE